jgi:hypothetical protein
MSVRIQILGAAVAVISLLCAGAEALPLAYEVESDASEFSASIFTEVVLTILINYPPATAGDSVTLTASEPMLIPLGGRVIVDSGLPGGFDGGARGLKVDSVALGAEAPPGETLLTLSDSGVMGGWPVALTAKVNAISIATNDAFEAALRPGQTSEDFAWGPVDVESTIILDVTLLVNLPTASEFPVWDGPIPKVDYVLPLAGTFYGTDLGTEFTISVDIADFLHEAGLGSTSQRNTLIETLCG